MLICRNDEELHGPRKVGNCSNAIRKYKSVNAVVFQARGY